MRNLSPQQQVAVDDLPAPSPALAGTIALLTTADNKPYWCNGTAWLDLTATGLTHQQVLTRNLGC